MVTTSESAPRGSTARGSRGDGYKWVALSNTTVGVLLATIDASIMLIAMPDIFRGIGLDPLEPANSFYLIFRVVQGIGAACLIGNSAAILTGAFPVNQRGLALGINNIAGISGVFIGLVLGGLLAPIRWRLVFLVSVPFGVFGTVCAYLKLEERGMRRRVPIDWLGNLTSAIGLILAQPAIASGVVAPEL